MVDGTVHLLPSSLSEVSINLGGGVCCLTFDLLYWLYTAVRCTGVRCFLLVAWKGDNQ